MLLVQGHIATVTERGSDLGRLVQQAKYHGYLPKLSNKVILLTDSSLCPLIQPVTAGNPA